MWPCLRNQFVPKFRSCVWRNIMLVPNHEEEPQSDSWGWGGFPSFTKTYAPSSLLFPCLELLGHCGHGCPYTFRHVLLWGNHWVIDEWGRPQWATFSIFYPGAHNLRLISYSPVLALPLSIFQSLCALFLLPVTTFPNNFIYKSLPLGMCVCGKPDLRQISMLLKI